MFEQDYIMRLIKEMVRAILKLLFNINTETPTEALLERAEEKEALEELLRLVRLGNIDEAENLLYEKLEEDNMEMLKVALLFYSNLNDLDDDYLLAHDFSREEVRDGLKAVIDKYGLGSIADIYAD